MITKNLFKAIMCVCTLAVLFVSASCNSHAGQKDQSTVSVAGTGSVSVRPDMIQLSISLNRTAQTTRLAQDAVNKMVRQALDVLKNAGIEDKNISTASLTFNPEYEYRPSRRVLVGQRAEQRITFSIHDIQNDSEKASQIIDRLVQINGIELNQMSFSVKNNTEYFIQSRELAFQKATAKAEQYAALSGLKVAKVLSIAEEGNQSYSPMSNRMMLQKMEEQAVAADAVGATVLPAGELEITTRIMVVFLLE